ncbi:MAG: ATP-binding protein [Planctomycetes bacterium]|jgi:predicted ATPase|nr:ATP-binding protein [Planctomycetota bacterium]
MITKVKFEGFKLLRDVEFALGRFNVIVGENGTGKSSILEGLHYLLQLAAPKTSFDSGPKGRLHSFFRGLRDPSAMTSKPGGKRFRLEIATPEIRSYQITSQSEPDAPQRPFVMSLQQSGTNEGRFEADFTQPNWYDDSLLAKLAPHHLSSVVRLRLDATQLGGDHYSDDQNPRVEYDGTGLASVLQELQNARDGRFEKIEADLQKVVPAARRIRTTRAKIVRREKIKITIDGQETWSDQEKTYIGAGIEVEWGNVGWVPARHLSEGTLLALGLCTVLHHRPPSLILLDDLDKTLHPKAQRELVQLLRTILASNDKLQILATTHSPFVVDEFVPEDVLVVASLDGNSSQVRRLSEHPKWNDKKPYLETGEFWSAVGERWAAEKLA